MYTGYVAGPLVQVHMLWVDLGGYWLCDKRVDNGISEGPQRILGWILDQVLMCLFTNRTMCLHVRNLLMRYAEQLRIQCLISIWFFVLLNHYVIWQCHKSSQCGLPFPF